jgi:hypothetical protein
MSGKELDDLLGMLTAVTSPVHRRNRCYTDTSTAKDVLRTPRLPRLRVH